MGKDAPLRVGTLRISLLIRNAHSLKEKRQVLRSLKDSVRAKFNVSVAELGNLDLWQSAEIGVAACSNDGRALNAMLSKVVDFVRMFPLAELVDYELEMY